MARATRSPKAPKSFTLNVGGIDNALVVRVGSGAQRSVYVIPISIAHLYALRRLSAEEQSDLDKFFASHPKIEAAMVSTLNIFDGMGDPIQPP